MSEENTGGTVPSKGINVVRVQFRRAGKLYSFSAGDLDLSVGDKVVVDSDRGSSLAEVVKLDYFLPGHKLDRELKPIQRIAKEHEINKPLRITPDDVSKFTREKIVELKLKMRLLKSEVQFGGSKIIVYFTAPGRVDFRGLVKEIANGLKTRVELKQVGARDETKLIGGVGICGREFCCSSFLREFLPVSIKMAKNQNLALNPSKVSGGCGRLLCCLTYEDKTYTHLKQKLPTKNTMVKHLGTGEHGKVIKGDILNQIVMAETSQGQMIHIPLAECQPLDKTTSKKVDEPADDWGEDLDITELSDELKKGKGSSNEPKSDRDGPKNSKNKGNRNRRPRRGKGKESGDRKPQGDQSKGGKKPGGNRPRKPKPKGGNEKK